jgi:hypothetical protein
MEIFSFALFTKWDENLKFLSSLAKKEDWDYSEPQKEIEEGNNFALVRVPTNHSLRSVLLDINYKTILNFMQ